MRTARAERRFILVHTADTHATNTSSRQLLHGSACTGRLCDELIAGTHTLDIDKVEVEISRL